MGGPFTIAQCLGVAPGQVSQWAFFACKSPFLNTSVIVAVTVWVCISLLFPVNSFYLNPSFLCLQFSSPSWGRRGEGQGAPGLGESLRKKGVGMVGTKLQIAVPKPRQAAMIFSVRKARGELWALWWNFKTPVTSSLNSAAQSYRMKSLKLFDRRCLKIWQKKRKKHHKRFSSLQDRYMFCCPVFLLLPVTSLRPLSWG